MAMHVACFALNLTACHVLAVLWPREALSPASPASVLLGDSPQLEQTSWECHPQEQRRALFGLHLALQHHPLSPKLSIPGTDLVQPPAFGLLQGKKKKVYPRVRQQDQLRRDTLKKREIRRSRSRHMPRGRKRRGGQRMGMERLKPSMPGPYEPGDVPSTTSSTTCPNPPVLSASAALALSSLCPALFCRKGSSIGLCLGTTIPAGQASSTSTSTSSQEENLLPASQQLCVTQSFWAIPWQPRLAGSVEDSARGEEEESKPKLKPRVEGGGGEGSGVGTEEGLAAEEGGGRTDAERRGGTPAAAAARKATGSTGATKSATAGVVKGKGGKEGDLKGNASSKKKVASYLEPGGNVMLSVAIQLVNSGQHAEAIKTFDMVLSESPHLASAYIGRGTAYALSGNYDKAIVDYSMCIQLAPNLVEGHRRRGQARYAAGKAEEAVEDLTRALELEPDDVQTRMERGLALMKCKRNWDAAADLRWVVEQEPDNPNYSLTLGQALTAGGDCQEAIEVYQAVLRRVGETKMAASVRRDILTNMGQAYREVVNIAKAEECYSNATAVEPSNPFPWRAWAVLKHSTGDHWGALQLAEKGLSYTPNNLDLLYYRASCLQAMGQFSKAYEAFSQILALKDDLDDRTHQYEAFYQRDITVYTASMLKKPVWFYHLDEDLDPRFKEAWSKKFNPAQLFPQYEMLDARELVHLKSKDQGGGRNAKLSPAARRLLQVADRLGRRAQYFWQGFMPNKRQFRMAGLAALEIMGAVRGTWERMAVERREQGHVGEAGTQGQVGHGEGEVRGAGTALEGSSTGVGQGSREEARSVGQDGGTERKRRSWADFQFGGRAQDEEGDGEDVGEQDGGEFFAKRRRGWKSSWQTPPVKGWRDIYSIAVRWRQVSEPVDAVVWIDQLTEQEFRDGFGSVTAMTIGQMKNVRYYYNTPRAMEMMKSRMVDEGEAWDGYNMPIHFTEEMKVEAREATSVHDLWQVVGKDFWVVTPCYSTAVPGYVMNGTRLTLVKMQGWYDFAIKTPGTPPRWAEYDKEMEAAWKELCDAFLDVTTKEKNITQYRKRIQDTVLRMTFYWYNFMPLARGTAMVGYVSLLGLFLAAGAEVEANIPAGLQADWEAILSPHVDQFTTALSSWLYPGLKYNPQWMEEKSNIPSLSKAFPTLLSALDALSFFDDRHEHSG